MGVGRVDEDLVPVDGDGPGAHAAPDRIEILARGPQLPGVLPDAIPGDGVHRLHDAAGTRNEHHPVMHQGRRLVEPGAGLPAPDELELIDVLPVDLVQRAVAPAVERAPPVEPVRRVGVLEHRVRDGCQDARLGAGRGAAQQHEERRPRGAGDPFRRETPSRSVHRGHWQPSPLRASDAADRPAAARAANLQASRDGSGQSTSRDRATRPARSAARPRPRGRSSRTAGRPVPASRRGCAG